MSDDPHEPDEAALEERLRHLLGEAETADADHLDEIELELRDVQDRFEHQRGVRHETEGLFDAEFEERLRKLHERAEAAKHRTESTVKQKRRNALSDREAARGLGNGLTVAYTIIGFPLVGAGVGWLVDKELGTTMGVAIGVVIGAALGMAGALMILARIKDS